MRWGASSGRGARREANGRVQAIANRGGGRGTATVTGRVSRPARLVAVPTRGHWAGGPLPVGRGGAAVDSAPPAVSYCRSLTNHSSSSFLGPPARSPASTAPSATHPPAGDRTGELAARVPSQLIQTKTQRQRVDIRSGYHSQPLSTLSHAPRLPSPTYRPLQSRGQVQPANANDVAHRQRWVPPVVAVGRGEHLVGTY